MCFLSDRQIEELCKGDKPLIAPFRKSFKHPYGVSVGGMGGASCSYDFSLGPRIRIPDMSVSTHRNGVTMSANPHNASELNYIEYELQEGVPFVVYPHTFLLAEVAEWVNMPVDLFGLVINKSTNARLGGALHPQTSFEPGWSGRATLELYSVAPYPVDLMLGMGIINVAFSRIETPIHPYGNRTIGSKYQNNDGLQVAKAG